MNKFETFDGGSLFTFKELDIEVNIEDGEVQVLLGNSNIDITSTLSPDELHELGCEWGKAKQEHDVDAAADFGDYQYEQMKDKLLDECQ